jgi:hypothetical protein
MMALLLFILLGWPFMVMFLNSNGSFVSQTLMVLMSFIILGPIAIIINFIALFAVIYRVNEREHTAVSLKKAWLFFKQNWVVAVEMSFLLFLMVNVAASIILVIAAVVVSLPFVMLGMIASYVGSEVFLWATIGVGILCLVIMIVLYGALAGVYQNACWVMLFERIQDGPVHSKILRLVTWFVSGSKSDEDKKLKAQKAEEGKIRE